MDTAVDTNILIYAHVSDCPEHDRARNALESILMDPTQRMILTVGILHELVHVITDTRRFQRPLPMPQAVALARTYLGRSNVAILAAEDVDFLNSLMLVEKYQLGRDRLADTLLAAVLRRYSVSRLLTRNVRDYAAFPFLSPENPCAMQPPS